MTVRSIAELPDVNINTGVQSINTESLFKCNFSFKFETLILECFCFMPFTIIWGQSYCGPFFSCHVYISCALQLHPTDVEIRESSNQQMLDAKQEARKMNLAILAVCTYLLYLHLFWH